MESSINNEAGISLPIKQNSCLEIERAKPQSVQQLEIDFRGLALVFLAPALGGFVYGFDIGKSWQQRRNFRCWLPGMSYQLQVDLHEMKSL